MRMSDPSILTVIVNYRTPDMTLKAAAAAMRAMQGLRGDIVIVENGSGDGSPARIAAALAGAEWNRDGRARLVDAGRNGGFGAGVNAGMRAGLADGSAADFVYLLNSDAFPDPDAIRVLRDHLVGTPRAGIAGSFIHGTDGHPHQTAFRFPGIASEFVSAAHTGPISRLLPWAVVAMPIPRQAMRVDWTAGASLMLRRAMLDAIGGFDEGFFLYYEETDLCRRARRAGWDTWYLPASSVAHVGSASTGMRDWTRVPAYWFDSRRRYFVRNHGPVHAAAATMARIAGGTIWKARQLLTGRPDRDPDRFLSDLVSHDLRALFHRSPPAGAAFPNPLAEDRK